jgi:hypothetical protein
MKKRGEIITFLSIIFLTSIISASSFLSIGDTLRNFGGENIILIAVFMLSFVFSNFALLKFFTRKGTQATGGSKTFAGVSALAVSMLVTYGFATLGIDIGPVFYNLGISKGTLDMILYFLIVGGFIYSIFKLGMATALMGGGLIIVFLAYLSHALGLDLIYEWQTAIALGFILFIIGAIWSWYVKKKSEGTLDGKGIFGKIMWILTLPFRLLWEIITFPFKLFGRRGPKGPTPPGTNKPLPEIPKDTEGEHLEVRPSQINNANPEGGEILINVVSNTQWTVHPNAPWISVTNTHGSHNGGFELIVQENKNTTTRLGTVTVRGVKIQRVIQVRQGWSKEEERKEEEKKQDQIEAGKEVKQLTSNIYEELKYIQQELNRLDKPEYDNDPEINAYKQKLIQRFKVLREQKKRMESQPQNLQQVRQAEAEVKQEISQAKQLTAGAEQKAQEEVQNKNKENNQIKLLNSGLENAERQKMQSIQREIQEMTQEYQRLYTEYNELSRRDVTDPRLDAIRIKGDKIKRDISMLSGAAKQIQEIEAEHKRLFEQYNNMQRRNALPSEFDVIEKRMAALKNEIERLKI